MRVILEGIDRIGKSTWAQRLCEKHGFGYFHPPKVNEPYSTFYERNRHVYLSALAVDNTVHDRSLISEFAYNVTRQPDMLKDLIDHAGPRTLVIIGVATEGFLEANLHDYENEVPGIKHADEETALRYAKRVNARYRDAWRELSRARRYYEVALNYIVVEDRERAWERISWEVAHRLRWCSK